MEDLAVFTAISHSGSFGKNAENAYGLVQYFKDLGHSFSPYGPPSRQITYILFIKIADLAFTRLIPRTTFCSCASSPYFFKTFGSMDSYPDPSVKGIVPTHVTFSFDVWLHETHYSLTSVC